MHKPASSAHWLTSWWQTPSGERLLADQAPIIAQEVRRFHGDSLLWLGCHSPSSEIVRRCMVRYRFYAALPGSCPSADLASFCANPQALPLPKASVNAVVVHHGLECVRDPRQVMREVSRVLVPGGKLVLCGFAPLSNWGLRYLANRARRMTGSGESSVRPVSRGRLLDWLAVLGFQVETEATFLHQRRVGWQRYPKWLPETWPTGERSFVLSATKQSNAYIAPDPTRVMKTRTLAPVTYPKLGNWRGIDRNR